jgi:anti-sigma factor RsiW
MTTMNPIDPRRDPPLSETDIQAYADGFLAPERAAHLRQYLGKRPGEARRVAFYGKLNQQIQDTFLPSDEPLPTLGSARAGVDSAPGRWLDRRIRGVRRNPLRALLTAVLAVVLALLAASGWMAASQVSEEALNNAAVMALAQAVADHSGIAGASLSTPSSLATAPGAPNLAPVGMHLVSERTARLGPVARAAEYVYLNADGEPVVLLVARTRQLRAESQWSAQRVGTLRLLTWSAHHQRYVLAGAADAHGLMRAADLMTLR